MPESISRILGHHHRQCDELFASAESAAAGQRWDEARAQYGRFVAGMEWHIGTEESRLFPQLEQHMGSSAGPTAVMRREHAELRELLEAGRITLAAEDAAAFTGLAETLLTMLQQHNLKEEHILYRMCDSMLGAQGAELARALQQEIVAPCR